MYDDSNDDDDDDEIALNVFRQKLNLPKSLTFQDYVDADRDLESGEAVTEDAILADLVALTNSNEEKDEAEEQETEVSSDLIPRVGKQFQA